MQQSTPDGDSGSQQRLRAMASAAVEAVETAAEAIVSAAEAAARRSGADGNSKQV